MTENTATATAENTSQKRGQKRDPGRKMIGRVISDKMDKTVTVEVVSSRRDPLYGKYVRTRARFKAHDEKNEMKAGDEVEIQEHRPLSHDKRFIVTRLVKKFVEE
jgi:small subunit ribosomal protein S17